MSSRESVEQVIRTALYDTLEASRLRAFLSTEASSDTDLVDAGVDSLDLVELFLRIETLFSVTISADDYAQLRSVASIVRYVDTRTASTSK